MRRMKYSNDIIRKVKKIINIHLRIGLNYTNPTEKSIRKLIRDAGDELQKISSLSLADSIGHKGVLEQDRVEFVEKLLNYPVKIREIKTPLNAFEISKIMDFPSPSSNGWNLNYAKKTQKIKDELLNKMVLG